MPMKHVNRSISICSMACLSHMKHNFGISGCLNDNYNISSAIWRRKSIHEVTLPNHDAFI